MKLAAHHNLWLALCAVALAAVCVASILGPVRFGKERRLRERAVVVRLSAIRAAELNYLRNHGVYTADFGTLVGGGYLADSLQYVPFGGGRRFDLAATVQVSVSGRRLPLVECGATYDAYLDGLDANSVANLIEEANRSGRYAGIRMGDINAGDTRLSINK